MSFSGEPLNVSVRGVSHSISVRQSEPFVPGVAGWVAAQGVLSTSASHLGSLAVVHGVLRTSATGTVRADACGVAAMAVPTATGITSVVRPNGFMDDKVFRDACRLGPRAPVKVEGVTIWFADGEGARTCAPGSWALDEIEDAARFPDVKRTAVANGIAGGAPTNDEPRDGTWWMPVCVDPPADGKDVASNAVAEGVRRKVASLDVAGAEHRNAASNAVAEAVRRKLASLDVAGSCRAVEGQRRRLASLAEPMAMVSSNAADGERWRPAWVASLAARKDAGSSSGVNGVWRKQPSLTHGTVVGSSNAAEGTRLRLCCAGEAVGSSCATDGAR